MYYGGLNGKKKESFRIDILLKFQIDNYAREQRLDRQEVIAQAVKFAHPLLSGTGGSIATYAHLRRKKVDVVETVVITPKLSEETLNQIEDIKRAKGRSSGKILNWALHNFFMDKEKKATGRLDELAFRAFCAPTSYLGNVTIDAPWIERAPVVPHIEHEKDLLPDRMKARTVYVGADFFLTMMTVLELRHGPRSRKYQGSKQIVNWAAAGKMSLVTSAAELVRFVGMGGAFMEARDQNHFSELIASFKSSGDFPHKVSRAITERVRCLSKIGVRVVATGLKDFVGACEFMRTSSEFSFTTLLGLATLAVVTPGDRVMLRFLSGPTHPAMLVWQEFSEDGRLMRMSSRDCKLDTDDSPQ
jgi:hypothetical protein